MNFAHPSEIDLTHCKYYAGSVETRSILDAEQLLVTRQSVVLDRRQPRLRAETAVRMHQRGMNFGNLNE
jgi:hypothetical protein